MNNQEFSRDQYRAALLVALMVVAPVLIAIPILSPRTTGKVLGFFSFFLLFASAAFGCRATPVKRFMGKLFARQSERVRFHCWLSFVILIAAFMHGVVHMVRKSTLFLHRGDVLLGDVSLALMVVVAFNGLFQRELINRYDHRTWWLIHVAGSAGAMAAALIHVLYAEGIL